MISHKLFGEFLSDVPAIMELLGCPSADESVMMASRAGLFGPETNSNHVDIECGQVFLVTERMTREEPVLKLLISERMFDHCDEKNSSYLPLDARQAFFFNRSPYGDVSMASYVESFHDGIKQFIDSLNSTRDIKKAEAGDKGAMTRLHSDLTRFLTAVKRGLETGKFHASLPYQPSTEELPFLFSSGYWSVKDVLAMIGRN